MPEIRFENAAVAGRLDAVDLTLAEARVGIIGANGSGKSTLARLVNGLVTPSEGRVLVDGLDTSRDGAAVRRRVGFVFTDPAAQVVMPTCVEDVELSLRRSVPDRSLRRAKAMEVLTRFGLADQAEQSVHTLSGGQRQLLAVAGVLSVSPDIVVADEPTTLLDLANSRRIADELFGLEQQLLLVTHDLELVTRCDRVLVVADGRISFDGPPELAVSHYVSGVEAR